jgi:hypothetical protein
MSADRVVIVRVLGIGNVAGSNNPVAFTSRAGLSYLGLSEVAGVVVDVGSQLSSNIDIFGALGSDPTTTFSVLSTAVTSQLLLSRGKRPVLAADGANVTVTEYVKPFGVSNSGNIYVTDTTNVAPGDMIRIANTVFEVFNVVSSTVLQVRRRWGCADVPIPMVVTGYGIFGSTVYSVNPGEPTGGVESLPVVISTAALTAQSRLQEDVIFRGIINKATTDTSAKGSNKIRLDCGSLMSFVRSAKFTPAQGGTRIFPKRADFAPPGPTMAAMQVDFWWQIMHDQRLYGTPFEVTGAVGDVRVPLMQVRSQSWGGMVALDNVAPWSNETIDGFSVYVAQVSTRYHLDPGDPTYMTSNTFLQTFREGWYLAGGFGPALEPTVTASAMYSAPPGSDPVDRARSFVGYTWSAQDAWFNPEKLGETTFIASDFATLIVDLLLGTFEQDLTFAGGCRAATEAAWLPFGVFGGVLNAQDIIDLPSLYTATAAITAAEYAGTELPFVPGDIGDSLFGETGVVLPYVHEDVKTVGDVLEELLKRSGLYMVYDKGKFRFGRWSARPGTPTRVNDTGLAEPKITLTFDRNNCVQTALLNVCWRVTGDTVTTQKVPINNVDLGIGALGKVVNLSHWMPVTTVEYLPSTEMFVNGVQLVTRYSQAAALVDVVYRNDVFDLIVGQQVVFSSDYVPNADGGMGVTLASGFVMKAARSWQTPTTAYTIALPGYLSPINRVGVYSCSGTVVSVSGNDVVIAPNDYTAPVGVATEGAPTSDTEAFDLTLSLQGGPVNVMLRDTYGTNLLAGDSLTSVNVLANKLVNLPNIAAVASPGDVIVLQRATSQSSVATLWDAFQADVAGQVVGSAANAYKWVL